MQCFIYRHVSGGNSPFPQVDNPAEIRRDSDAPHPQLCSKNSVSSPESWSLDETMRRLESARGQTLQLLEYGRGGGQGICSSVLD